jgi:hypothetical protein
MPAFIDLTNNIFGRLTVLKRMENTKDGKARWLCQCQCGKQVIVQRNNLRSGSTSSCGCLAREKSKERETKHGQSRTRLYSIWKGMKKRCNNPSEERKARIYKDKGISVCSQWYDFNNFYSWAINNGYSDKLTIDRKDGNRDYCPENCRWIDMKSQQRNKTTNRLITYNGVTKCVSEWAEEYGVRPGLIIDRLNGGWSVEDSLNKPVVRKIKHENK